MWTEYFKIHWDEIVEDPGHDPDDPCSLKYMVTFDNLDNEGLREHGDEYMDAYAMQRRHMGARQGKKTHEDGTTGTVWIMPGEWVFSGESEKVKSVHWLHNEIADDPDIRLAHDQTYTAAVYWKLDHLTYNGREFEVVESDNRFRKRTHTFSAHSPGRTKIDICYKRNTEVSDGPYIRGGSQLFWTKTVDARRTFSSGFLTALLNGFLEAEGIDPADAYNIYKWKRDQSKKSTNR